MFGVFRTMSERNRERAGRLAIALPIAATCGGVLGYTLGTVIASADPQSWAVAGIVTTLVASHAWILYQLWKEKIKKT